MRSIDAIRKPPVTIAPGATIAEAARLMDSHVVGALVVMDGDRPLGILTDRDIVVRAVARGIPDDARVDSVMSAGVIAVDADVDLRETLAVFRSHAIRRLPLVEGGRIVGVLTTDDLLIDLVADLGDLVRPITGQVVFGYPEPSDLPARRDAE
jgi:signal-transduction protein with cAMP-binding, CBS, and nucleotidyltransferase domain